MLVDALDTAGFVAAALAAGIAFVFLFIDYGSRTTRPLVVWLLTIAGALAIGTADILWFKGKIFELNYALISLESMAIIAGVEWGRRIGLTATGGGRQAANVLFRIAQFLVVVHWGLYLGYLYLFPETAGRTIAGAFRIGAIEFAIFVPIVATAMLLVMIAILILVVIRIDRAERARLYALLIAGPFFLSGLMVSLRIVPFMIAIGLIIFIAGSLRYLMIQSQRGVFMRQFLSPEVARLVQHEGLSPVLKRERRPLSVVMCDLRGFTAFARHQNSDRVTTLLEQYYAIVGEVAAEHGGVVKDHAGDGMLLLVGAPLPLEDHAERAAKIGMALHPRVKALLKEADVPLGFGVGVATGNVTVGAIRGAGRLEYVAVGNAVNLAARLCSRAEDGEVLADQRTCREMGAQPDVEVREREPEPLKGFPEPIPVCEIRSTVEWPVPAPSRRRRKIVIKNKKKN